MLNKIGMLTWIEAMLLTVLVGHYVPSVNAVLTSLKLPIKVFELEVSVLYVVPGTVIAVRDESVVVQCGTGRLGMKRVQRPGRRPVMAREFAGSRALLGQRLG